MKLKITFFFALLIACFQGLYAQTGSITGVVHIEGAPLELAQLTIEDTEQSVHTDSQGKFTFSDLAYGTYKVTSAYMGFATSTQTAILSVAQPTVHLDYDLTEQKFELDEVVVTGTKTVKRQTDSPVIVNIIDSKTISNVQACNLSEGLKFQPGLRVETDCQTCNYTQLRMNGMTGGYSQILINGRPIFSPLTGLYGMEQLPANMIDRLEIVRGGGSSLYGSSAIGGTVNLITKIPKKNGHEIDYTYQNVDGQANDHSVSGNATLVSESNNSGVSLFMNHRNREMYDANGDNFSEIPLVKNTAIGANMFLLPGKDQKVELNVSRIHEYRFGGEMIDNESAYLAQQSEERTHDVWMASADYQINFNDDKTSLITYLAWQNTDREHYTGIQPDAGTIEYDDFMVNPPYGTSVVSTYNIGTQLNHKINQFLTGKNVLTFGLEYLYDDVLDNIPAYNYIIDQTTTDLGMFVQSDWELTPNLSLLTGLRMDDHNLVDQLVLSPRTSLLYKWKENTQFRLSYGSGFRAPQALDADLHIAFAGGGISRVSLSPDLTQENSQSLSASINYDKMTKKWIAGFTLEGFYNQLTDAFVLQPIGEDEYGELFVKENGDEATVQGATLELRANYNRKVQLESGFTLQSSRYNKPVEYIEGVAGIRDFIRTPNDYGYAIITFTPNKKWNATANYVYTGKMKAPHFAGAVNQTVDEIITTNTFSDVSTKVGYTIPYKNLKSNIELYGGVKNILNAYQDDFDIGKNRDSNFIYGPAMPRTFYIGVKLMGI